MGEHLAGMGERRGAYRVLWRDRREGEHLKDPGIAGRKILKLIDLAKDRDRWPDLVNAVLNLMLP
jgi:hypothetical protein